MTGTYYLCTMLTTESGEILKWRSEGTMDIGMLKLIHSKKIKY